MSETFISIQHLTKKFDRTERPAVSEINLDIMRGELLVFLGEHGSGKTTLLRMINRLLEPSAGSVVLEGKDTKLFDPVALRRRIGYVFQEIGLFPHMSIMENVAVVPTLLGAEGGDMKGRVEEMLELVGLPSGSGQRMPHELSRNQSQRVAIARALAASPALLLMDDPFREFDPVTRDGLQTEVKRVQHSLKLTVLFSTRDVTEALLLADRVAVLHEGRIVALDTPGALMTRPPHPYVAELVETPKRQAYRLEVITGPRGF